ncbi:hypothetical protein [Type-D symbiont of Plautia stali]|uniref:hypothetical protein n=1 Tax=Type-D symbiont of Plautia stali TaxID=1560356 RepID=UPI00128E9A0C|nr:hypothetical protein [Type-D symbiont of Plautia stali]
MEQSVENRLDQFLMHPPAMTYRGSKRCAVEFLRFGIKEARAHRTIKKSTPWRGFSGTEKVRR